MELTSVLIVISFITRAVAQNSTFCSQPYQPGLCPNYNHIACITYWNTKPLGSCPSDYKIVNMSLYAATITQTHNKLRNQLAGGGVNGLPTAERMPTVVSYLKSLKGAHPFSKVSFRSGTIIWLTSLEQMLKRAPLNMMRVDTLQLTPGRGRIGRGFSHLTPRSIGFRKL